MGAIHQPVSSSNGSGGVVALLGDLGNEFREVEHDCHRSHGSMPRLRLLGEIRRRASRKSVTMAGLPSILGLAAHLRMASTSATPGLMVATSARMAAARGTGFSCRSKTRRPRSLAPCASRPRSGTAPSSPRSNPSGPEGGPAAPSSGRAPACASDERLSPAGLQTDHPTNGGGTLVISRVPVGEPRGQAKLGRPRSVRASTGRLAIVTSKSTPAEPIR